MSERELARIHDKLMDLLSRRDIKDEELKRLLEELRRSMMEYMDALRREMQRNPERFNQQFPVDPGRRLTEQDIRRMLEHMRDIFRDGDKEALRRMLSQLREMMQNMRTGQPSQRHLDPNHPAQRMMRDLNSLIRRQQQLMDESFRRGQQGRKGSEAEREADRDAARRQNELRKQLGDLMRRLGEMTGKVPDNFGNADREMRRAERDLGRGRPGRAVGPQGRALRELSRGMSQAMRRMGRQFGLGPGRGGRYQGDRNRRFGPDRDPLGRRQDGMGPLDQDRHQRADRSRTQAGPGDPARTAQAVRRDRAAEAGTRLYRAVAQTVLNRVVLKSGGSEPGDSEPQGRLPGLPGYRFAVGGRMAGCGFASMSSTS